MDKNTAHQAYLRGDYRRAIAFQMRVVSRLMKAREDSIMERKLYCLYLYSAGQLSSAVNILRQLESHAPDDSEIPENIGVMLRQQGDLPGAVEYLLKAHKMAPEKSNICDGLAHTYGNLGNEEQCQHFGKLSLELKDAEAAKSPHIWPIPDKAPPAFSFEEFQSNVISFSLFGDKPRYLRGALRNAELAPDLYPGWICRFYVDDTVPTSTVHELKELGAQLVKMDQPDPFYEGLMWRFKVIGDPTVKRFLVRDCDSVINVKERVAVDEWLASDKWFHMMRDFISHTEMILAGMWGGVNGVLPEVSELREKFCPKTAPTRTFDQHFLREMVWPTMRQSVLVHDSAYTGTIGSVPFPSVGQLCPRRHVGQNEAAVKPVSALDLPEEAESKSERQSFFVFGLNKSGTTFLQSLLDAHPNVNCPSEHHLTTVRNMLDQGLTSYRRVIEDIDRKTAKQGVRLDEDRLREVLYGTWVRELMNTGAGKNTTHVGLNDNRLAESLPEHFEQFPEARFVYIVRDPRDVAVSLWHHRLRTEPDFAESGTTLEDVAIAIASKWMVYLKAVQEHAESHPGRIEMVRYEDLIDETMRQQAMSQVLGFLELSDEPELIRHLFEATDLEKMQSKEKGEEESGEYGFYRTGRKGNWRTELTQEQIWTIEYVASDMMERLRYPISNPPPTHRRTATEAKPEDVALPA
ncbi:MAG: hypothetical protein HKN23_00910 [Verrucomicrobiales bacterium]|nr:hypothetical protein [Verrucomicrobiales bacterium]